MKEYTIHSKDWIATVFENGKKKKKIKKMGPVFSSCAPL